MAGLLFVVSISTILAQNQKSEEILKRPFEKEILKANFTYSDSNRIKSINIYLYTEILAAHQSKKYITLFYGSPAEFYSFLNQVDNFITENLPDASTELYGQKVLLTDYGMPKSARIYGKDTTIYSKIYSKEDISHIRKVFVNWASNQGIVLNL